MIRFRRSINVLAQNNESHLSFSRPLARIVHNNSVFDVQTGHVLWGVGRSRVLTGKFGRFDRRVLNLSAGHDVVRSRSSESCSRRRRQSGAAENTSSTTGRGRKLEGA